LPARRLVLGGGRFQVHIAAPGAEFMDEYGRRFDTLGHVAAVVLDGQNFLGPPGLADEFGLQRTPGYDDAAPGEAFLKIGIGELVRLDQQPYQFARPYPVATWAPVVETTAAGSDGVAPPPRAAAGDPTHVTMCQNHAGRHGWAYEYRKSYTLSPAETRLEIDYRLVNTGARPFDTDQYNHNFFCFGTAEVSPQYVLETALPIDPPASAPPWLLRGHGRLPQWRPAPGGGYVASKRSAAAEHNYFCLNHVGNGQAVIVRGDYPVDHFAFWANHRLISPEVFIAVRVAPGQSLCWRRTYQFLNAAS
jgi:hypothetical protein